MSPKDIPSEELWKKAAAKGYKHGVHRAEDRQRKKQPCGPKTRYDQDCALKYYEKCVLYNRLFSSRKDIDQVEQMDRLYRE